MKRRLQSTVALLSAALLVACGTLEMEAEYTPTHERATTTSPMSPVTQMSTLATPTPPLPADLGKLAYVQGGDVWVRELPDGEPQRLTADGCNSEPHWSPSGEWLTFRKGDDMWVMRADGANVHRIPTASPQDCVWSPVADRLGYISGRASLYIIEPDELADTGPRGKGHVLLQPAIEEEPLTTLHSLVWSPDGRQLAYVLQSGQPGALPDRVSIGAVDLESGPHELYALPSPPQDGLITAGWTPDGQSILFWIDTLFSASAMADGLSLACLPVEGGEPTVVTDFTLLHPDFRSRSLAGQCVALTVGAGRETWTNKRIALVDVETGSIDYLTDETTSAFSPALSPDGRAIAYVAAPDIGHVGGGDTAKAGTAQRRIWVMNVDGSNQRPVTGDPAYRDERPLWSADGSHVLLARMNEGGHSSVWLLDLADGTLQRVVDQLTPAPDWFGNYGHIAWDQFFDWWTGH